MNKQIIIKTMQEELQTKEVEVLTRLMGGMSNYTYVVKGDDKLYTFRIPGEYAEYFVDRNIEKENLKLFESLDITNETIYLNTTTGIKIANYIEGTPLIELDHYPYEKIVAKLKKIHNSEVLASNDYEPFLRLKQYEGYLFDIQYKHSNKYNELKSQLMNYQEYLENTPKVLCHGDSQPSNFVVSTDDVYVVDFEFSGNADLMYDLACFGNVDFNRAKEITKYYFKEELNEDIIKRLYLWRIFQCFQWFNVAIFKDLHGLSESLKIDFLKVGNIYLDIAEKLLNELKNGLYLTGFTLNKK